MKVNSLDSVSASETPPPWTIGVVRGGDSVERQISLKTGNAVLNALSSKPCETKAYDTSPTLGERLEEEGVDVVFLALHGGSGEDGTIQAMLDWRGIPYTGPGAKASALCLDKLRTRQLFDHLNVPAPDWFRLDLEEPITNKGSFERMVVKPRLEGSSFGLSIVKEEGLTEAVEKSRQYDSEVIVEEYVPGYEVTVGVFRGENFHLLPPVGIRPAHEFFDFETKYTKGLTEYDVPAELEESEHRKLEQLTEKIVREAGTEDLSRIDYIRDESATFRLLEINTIPGLTETSLLPKSASEAGIAFEDLVWKLVQNALDERQCRRK